MENLSLIYFFKRQNTDSGNVLAELLGKSGSNSCNDFAAGTGIGGYGGGIGIGGSLGGLSRLCICRCRSTAGLGNSYKDTHDLAQEYDADKSDEYNGDTHCNDQADVHQKHTHFHIDFYGNTAKRYKYK